MKMCMGNVDIDLRSQFRGTFAVSETNISLFRLPNRIMLSRYYIKDLHLEWKVVRRYVVKVSTGMVHQRTAKFVRDRHP